MTISEQLHSRARELSDCMCDGVREPCYRCKKIALTFERVALEAKVETLVGIRDWLCPGCMRGTGFNDGDNFHNGFSQEEQMWCKAPYPRELITALRKRLEELGK